MKGSCLSRFVAFLALFLLGGCGIAEEALETAVEGAVYEGTFTSVYEDYFDGCANCHAPGAPGATSDIEKTLDFSSRDSAYDSIMSTASGLVGNQEACNGVSFVVPGNSSSSLIVAVVDEDIRQGFDLSSNPDCNVDSISDMTVKMGFQPDSSFLNNLKSWVDKGALND